jgi:tRNA pseudouridine13 synthase
MKLKQQPEDFLVEELTDIQPASAGEFSLYRLEKKGWTTPDALQAIRRRWQLQLQRVAYGGLKDRHAHTIQYVTVWRGPRRGLTHGPLRLQYLGQTNQAYRSSDIRANRFRLVLRSVDEEAVSAIQAVLESVGQCGVPNYFDDQRFGSVHGDAFVARELVRGRFEEALKLALAAPYLHDRAAQKKEKAILQAQWGQWGTCKAALPRGHARSLVDYLAQHPADFRGAVARLRPDLRGLYLSAFQSHLWNRMLARWLTQHIPSEDLVMVHLRLGPAPFPRAVEESQRHSLTELHLPLPTARGEADPADPRVALMLAVLADEGLTREQLKVPGLREVFFSRGERPAWCLPLGLSREFADDDRNPGRKKLTLRFELPRGSYATLLVKRIFSRAALEE